jgi:flavin reductase (DIM6/NTAB) family NADH-FMN oxidoreductase RutF
MDHREIGPEDLPDNPFTLIGTDWMLITAGAPERFNTMTASWGGLGVLWDRKACFIFVRPTRHTFHFLESAGTFTLSFFEERYRPALRFCGTRSGRDTDKIAGSGLTPAGAGGSVWFREARLVMVCRKLYFQDLGPERFLDPRIADLYPKKDYHRMYVGEIERCLLKA